MTVATAIAAANAATGGAAVTATTLEIEVNAGTPPYAATAATVGNGLNAATPAVTTTTLQPAVTHPSENNTIAATTSTHKDVEAENPPLSELFRIAPCHDRQARQVAVDPFPTIFALDVVGGQIAPHFVFSLRTV